MPKRGRKLTLTSDKIDRIVEIVERGNFRYVVQQRLGISPRTFSSWVERGKKERLKVEDGEQDPTVFTELVTRLEEAEAKVHQRLLQDVIEAEDPKCKMWFLERRWNKLYSRNPNAVIDDETGETIKRDMVAQLAEKLAQFVEDD